MKRFFVLLILTFSIILSETGTGKANINSPPILTQHAFDISQQSGIVADNFILPDLTFVNTEHFIIQNDIPKYSSIITDNFILPDLFFVKTEYFIHNDIFTQNSADVNYSGLYSDYGNSKIRLCSCNNFLQNTFILSLSSYNEQNLMLPQSYQTKRNDGITLIYRENLNRLSKRQKSIFYVRKIRFNLLA